MYRLIVVAGVLMLSGCAVGIQPGKDYPSDTFTVAIGYQEAYRRADAQPRACLQQYPVSGNLFADNQSGVIRVGLPNYGSADLMRINLHQVTPETTEVKVTVYDGYPFDWKQVVAMRGSIETGSLMCRGSGL